MGRKSGNFAFIFFGIKGSMRSKMEIKKEGISSSKLNFSMENR